MLSKRNREVINSFMMYSTDIALCVLLLLSFFRLPTVNQWDNINVEFHGILAAPLLVSSVVLSLYHLVCILWRHNSKISYCNRRIFINLFLCALLIYSLVITAYQYSVVER